MSAIIAPTDFVKEHAPWSTSKVDTAVQCPYKFWLRYVEKEKRKAPPKFDAVKGLAGHKALEYALSGRPVTSSIRFASEEFKLTTKEAEELSLFQDAMEHFVSRFNYYCKKHDVNKILTEKELAVDFNGAKIGYWSDDCFIRGVVDVLAFFKDKPYALILDHKTGRVTSLDKHEKQFETYRMMVKAHYPHVQKIISGINWVQGDTIELGKFIEVPTIEPLVSDIVNHCNESTKNVNNFEETRRSGLCGWCDFRYLCSAYPESDTNGDENQKEEGNLSGAVQESMGPN